MRCTRCGTANASDAKFCKECGAALAMPASSREQRKTVTVVFCDLVGSTDLGESTDPEALRTVLARYFDEMRAIVERHGGSVEKFIGDAVMAVFGVPVVHEDDPLRACRAAIEMRDALPGLGLRGRIGVNTGEVVTGTVERLATGDAVNVAARLEQAAAAGEVLVGAETLLRVRGAVDVGETRRLEVKGKSAPVAAAPLLGLVERDPRRARTRMVGREAELERLRAAFAEAAAGRGCRLFNVLGPAGIGKSRLVAEFLGSLDATVVVGRCPSYGDGITYLPALEIVKQLGLPSEPRAAAALASLLASGEVASADRVAWGFRRLLEERAEQRPLVCVLDDLHWAEPTLIDLVEHVVLFSRDAPILVLCMARPELLELRPTWGRGAANAETVLLEPLDADETDELLDALGVADAELRRRIRATAEGNPLFAEEVLALAEETRDVGVAIPPTIEGLLAARLDRLDPGERSALESGAVEGRTFHLEAVATLLDDAADVGSRLLALVRKELVRPAAGSLGGDAFRFRHLLIRDAAYAGMPKAVRASMHERLANWLEPRLEGQPECDELVGYHLEQAALHRAELGEPALGLDLRAGDRLAAAGCRALWRGDLHGASRLLVRAAGLTRPLRHDLHLELALAHALNRDPTVPATACIKLLRAAAAREREAGDAVAEAVAALIADLWEVTSVAGAEFDVAQLDARTRETAGLLEERGDDAALVYLLAAYGLTVAAFTGRWDEWAASSERALDHARRAGHRWATGFGLPLALALGSRPADEALVALDRVLGRNCAPHDLVGRAWIVAMLGDFDEARALADEAVADVAEYGGFPAGWMLAEIATLAGDDAAAEDHLRRQVEFFEERGQVPFLSSYAPMLARTLCVQGRHAEAEPLALLGRELGDERDLATQIFWRQALALVRSGTGKHQEAVALASEAVALADTTDGLNMQGETLVDLASVLEHAGAWDEAFACRADALERFTRKRNVPRAAQLRALLAEPTSL